MATLTKPAKTTKTTKTVKATKAPGASKGLTKVEGAPVASTTIPAKSFYESYISRMITSKLSDFDVFDHARKSRDNVLIEGPTGPGKTSAVLAYSAREERSFYAIPSNIGIEPSQLFGKYIPSTDGGFEWVDGPVTKLVREGGVLLINEVNFIPERVATVLFGLLDKRRQIILLDHKGEVIDAHDDLLIVADMNPDYEGTRPLNKAFRNRFSIQLDWGYDSKVEMKLVKSKALLELANAIRVEAAKGTYETPVATNMLMEFEKMVAGIGQEFAELNFINHFAQDERDAIKLLVDTYSTNIERDLAPKVEVTPEDVGEDGEGEDEDESGSKYPLDHPIWDQRENEPDGWVDPEWGTKGVHWSY